MKIGLPQSLRTQRVVFGSFLAALLLAPLARPAAAQTTAERKWEIEFHGGGMLVRNPTSSTVSLPGAGEPFTTGPGQTSRRVSSWYFGDGATLLNQLRALPFFNLPLMTSLDPVLGGLLAERRHGGSFGVRVSRALNSRLAAEFSLDYSLAQLEITGAAVTGIATSRDSFLAVFNDLLRGPFSQPRVTSTADLGDGKARQVVSTGTLNINLKTSGNLIPYVTAGAGVISSVGATPSATLAGNYQFLLLPFLSPHDQSDTVSVRDSRPDHALVGVFGGGVRWHASPRWGVRFDVRGHLSRNKVSTLLDANSATVTRTAPPLTTFSTPTNPSIQFSNGPARPSSLSGPRIDGVETFSGNGIQSQFNITAGVFWRF